MQSQPIMAPVDSNLTDSPERCHTCGYGLCSQQHHNSCKPFSMWEGVHHHLSEFKNTMTHSVSEGTVVAFVSREQVHAMHDPSVTNISAFIEQFYDKQSRNKIVIRTPSDHSDWTRPAATEWVQYESLPIEFSLYSRLVKTGDYYASHFYLQTTEEMGITYTDVYGRLHELYRFPEAKTEPPNSIMEDDSFGIFEHLVKCKQTDKTLTPWDGKRMKLASLRWIVDTWSRPEHDPRFSKEQEATMFSTVEAILLYLGVYRLPQMYGALYDRSRAAPSLPAEIFDDIPIKMLRPYHVKALLRHYPAGGKEWVSMMQKLLWVSRHKHGDKDLFPAWEEEWQRMKMIP